MPEKEPTQLTQPKKAGVEPIEIPVPDRKTVDDALANIAKPQVPGKSKRKQRGR